MTQSKRGRLSATQKADLWSRWKAGQSLNEIGRALGKDHVVVHFLLAQSWWDCTARPSAIAANADTGRTRRHLSRDRWRIVASPDRQRFAASGVDGEPGGGPPWRAAAVSSQ